MGCQCFGGSFSGWKAGQCVEVAWARAYGSFWGIRHGYAQRFSAWINRPQGRPDEPTFLADPQGALDGWQHVQIPNLTDTQGVERYCAGCAGSMTASGAGRGPTLSSSRHYVWFLTHMVPVGKSYDQAFGDGSLMAGLTQIRVASDDHQQSDPPTLFAPSLTSHVLLESVKWDGSHDMIFANGSTGSHTFCGPGMFGWFYKFDGWDGDPMTFSPPYNNRIVWYEDGSSVRNETVYEGHEVGVSDVNSNTNFLIADISLDKAPWAIGHRKEWNTFDPPETSPAGTYDRELISDYVVGQAELGAGRVAPFAGPPEDWLSDDTRVSELLSYRIRAHPDGSLSALEQTYLRNWACNLTAVTTVDGLRRTASEVALVTGPIAGQPVITSPLEIYVGDGQTPPDTETDGVLGPPREPISGSRWTPDPCYGLNPFGLDKFRVAHGAGNLFAGGMALHAVDDFCTGEGCPTAGVQSWIGFQSNSITDDTDAPFYSKGEPGILYYSGSPAEIDPATTAADVFELPVGWQWDPSAYPTGYSPEWGAWHRGFFPQNGNPGGRLVPPFDASTPGVLKEHSFPKGFYRDATAGGETKFGILAIHPVADQHSHSSQGVLDPSADWTTP